MRLNLVDWMGKALRLIFLHLVEILKCIIKSFQKYVGYMRRESAGVWGV